MLISFSVENFRSIASRQELSMLAEPLSKREDALGNVYENEKYGYQILKSAVIYGANASGKSNLLKAMESMIVLVLHSIDLKVHHKMPFEPFQLSPVHRKYTEFTIRYIAEDNNSYEYGFTFNSEGISGEHLYSWPNNRLTKIFDREFNQIAFGAKFRGDKKFLEETLLHNHLLLTKAANSNYEFLLPAYNFFAHQFRVYVDLRPIVETQKIAIQDKEGKNQIMSFLKNADTGIEDFFLTEEPNIFEPAGMLSERAQAYRKPPKLITHVSHSVNDVPDGRVSWPLENESSGTQRLFTLAGPIISALQKNRVFVVDELDNSLHPDICRFIINQFNSNTRTGAQLIFTTHDTSIMRNDIFRRDQIWFTDKSQKGETSLFPLSSFERTKVRDSIPYDEWYLSGRFGGVPIVSDFEYGTEEEK